MKDQQTVQQFIELRSRGVPYVDIVKKLDVAKSTLILWSREHRHLIENLRAIDWEEFVDRTLASKKDRLKAVFIQLSRLDAELARRDLASIPTPRLQGLAEQLRRRLDRECGTTRFSAGVELSRDDDTRQAVQDWNA